MIAPAPTQSSKAGRREPSFHRSPAGMSLNDAGEREYLSPARRTPASSALTDAAKAVADSSFQRYGKTMAPLLLAISTQVENESTSTITTTSAPGARCRTQFTPHSHLTSKP